MTIILLFLNLHYIPDLYSIVAVACMHIICTTYRVYQKYWSN